MASALYAAGRRVFSRSFKYHRPRGLLCVSGNCANCLMNVDGVPNVRTCTHAACPGMEVRSQNAWPSLDRDALAILDRMDRLMPVGFYYKTFIRPRFMWRLVSRVIRRVAGIGRIDIDRVPETQYDHLYDNADVAVVGGGPAGMAASIEAARAGARVVLIDDQPSLGGHLRYQVQSIHDVTEYTGLPGFEIARTMTEEVAGYPHIQVLSAATAFGLYEGNLLGILQGRRVIKLRSRNIIVATGCHEAPPVFPNNDLPGIMLGEGAQRFLNLYGVMPGRKALVATDNDSGYSVALDLQNAGVEVQGVADARTDTPEHTQAASQLAAAGVPLYSGYRVARAHGSRWLSGATISSVAGGERRIACDLLCVSTGTQPATALLRQAGCSVAYDDGLGEHVPGEKPPGVFAAGDVTGVQDLRAALLQGRLKGMEATSCLEGPGSDDVRSGLPAVRGQLEEVVSGYRSRLKVPSSTSDGHRSRKSFVCICEDVTDKDLRDAVREGFDDIQTLKRYSTFSMGPCQGKMCQAAAVAIAARETGRSIQETGSITGRPPVQPVSLGALAGPSHMPIRLTPMHQLHLRSGARMMEVGLWSRPHSYGPVEDEYRAVRERVGIIDVSTLGKLDVRGSDAATLLDRVYANTHSNLRIGRTRYGVVCSDSGVILDDGTVSRLAEDRFYVTTGSGNTDLVEEWLKWWAAGSGMCVHVTNVTAGYGAINVAGPRARDVLALLTDTELTTDAFRYMANICTTVAGVPALMMRIGFVGEMGWEIHVPAEYGEYMWDTLLNAGREYGIAPFGVEAQRVLRLEKKHIIPGQDTDTVSNPLEADMAWVVRWEKEDFIGKPGLEVVRDRGLREKLVGFVMRDGVVPEDGDPVVLDRRPVGRVTSARTSYVLGVAVGMAWVPESLAADGNEIWIMVGGKRAAAKVVSEPFYDPEGARLRA